MPSFEVALDKRFDLQLPVYAESSEVHHLMHDEEQEIVVTLWDRPEPHIAAVIQTNHIETLAPLHTQKEAQQVQNDDIMVVDIRSLPSTVDAAGNVHRPFGNIDIPADNLYLIIGTSIFNHVTHHGMVALGLGDSVSVGSQGHPSLRGMSSTAPYHFDVIVDDESGVHVQNSFAPQGTHIYSGSYAQERLDWTDQRFKIAIGRPGFWERVRASW